MFGLGFFEIAVVLIVALLVLGPEKLPKIARQLGRGLRELRRVAGEFQSALNTEVEDLDRAKQFKDELAKDLAKVMPRSTPPGAVPAPDPAAAEPAPPEAAAQPTTPPEDEPQP